MLLNLGPVFEVEGAEIPFSYSFGAGEPLIPDPVSVEGRVYNKTGIVRLEAEAAFTVKTQCARCGEPVLKEERLPVVHILIRHAQSEDEDLYIAVDSAVLDLDALVAEDIILSLPQRYLCREDCKGLCPMCGADLNRGSCGCKKRKDPRWDALSEILNG